MSYPKKTNGWRNLILGNKHFRWCFVAKPENGLLKLQGSSSSCQQVIVTLSNWREPWINFKLIEAIPNEPKDITPKLVVRAIEFALENGWEPEESGSTIHFELKDDNFILLEFAK